MRHIWNECRGRMDAVCKDPIWFRDNKWHNAYYMHHSTVGIKKKEDAIKMQCLY